MKFFLSLLILFFFSLALTKAQVYDSETPLDTFTDICDGTNSILVGLDDALATIPSPFPITLYAHKFNTNTEIYISTNGIISFQQPLSSSSFSFYSVAPYGVDIVSSLTGICISLNGSSPNRKLVIQWSGSRFFDYPISNVNFQVVFHEDSDNIDFLYGSMICGQPECSNVVTGENIIVGINGGNFVSEYFRPTNGTANTIEDISLLVCQYFVDSDNDGHGYPLSPMNNYPTCAREPGFSADSGDCNDNNLLINPSMPDICDYIDNDCSGTIDDGVSTTFYRDADSDGYGDPNSITVSCNSIAPNGFTTDTNDCDDTDASLYSCLDYYSVSPSTSSYVDVCSLNTIDIVGQVQPIQLPFEFTLYDKTFASGSNIFVSEHGLISFLDSNDYWTNSDFQSQDANNYAIFPYWDDLVSRGPLCYGVLGSSPSRQFVIQWVDSGIYGELSTHLSFQVVLTESVETIEFLYGTMIDSNTGIAFSGQNATIGLKKNSNLFNRIGYNQENSAQPIMFSPAAFCTNFNFDDDLDGYGSTESAGLVQCTSSQPSLGYSLSSDDCNDNSAIAYPGATEVCNKVDDNCDGSIDEGIPSTTFFTDMDLDGYGDATYQGCVMSGPSSLIGGDCDDSLNFVNPNATEVCDHIDNDCDGFVDEGVYGCNVFLNVIEPFRSSKRSSVITAPAGVVLHNFFLYAADVADHVIRKVDPLTGSMVVFAGQVGITGNQDGHISIALFNSPTGVALAESTGDLFIIDANSVIRKINIASGAVSTLPGIFTNPTSVASTSTGRKVFVSDPSAHVVFVISDSATVSVYCGQLGVAGNLNGVVSVATLNQPKSLAYDNNGLLFIGEGSGDVRVFDGTNVALFAGQPGNPGSALGPAIGGGQIGDPLGLDFENGQLYIADGANKQIRVVGPNGIEVFGPATSVLDTPYAITFLGPFATVSDITGGNLVKLGTCNSNGFSSLTECMCFSGFSGNECEITPILACNLIAPSSSLLTSSLIPTVNAPQTYYQSDILYMQLDSPLVNYRVTQNTFLNSVNCPNKFQSIQDYVTPGCVEHFNVQVPWVNRVACGFVRDNSDPTYLIWRGIAQSNLYDLAGFMRNQEIGRTTLARHKVAVRFPRSVNVTAYPLNVLSDVNLLAALTYQAVDTTVSPPNAIFSFTTSLQWPYQVSILSLTTAPNGWTASSIIETTSPGMCSTLVGSICVQSFDVIISTDLSACRLDGVYTYSAGIVCRTSDCPTSLVPSTVIATIASEDFCVEVDASADLSGSLAIYREIARLTPAANFAQFDNAYFRAQLTSTSTIESVDLVRVSYWRPGATSSTVIYDRVAGPTTGFTFTEETTPTLGQTYSDFNVVLDQTNFPQWPEDVVSFRVDATIEATFKDTAKRFNNKRIFEFSFEQNVEESKIIFSRNGQLSLRNQLVMVNHKDTTQESSNSSTVAFSMIVLVLSITFALLF